MLKKKKPEWFYHPTFMNILIEFTIMALLLKINQKCRCMALLLLTSFRYMG